MMCVSMICFADQKAVTENGSTVILKEDGTWKYEKESADKKEVIPVNPKSFVKSADLTFQLRSRVNTATVYLNPDKWRVMTLKTNEAVEKQFRRADKDMQAMLITEKIEIPLETLASIALENAKRVASDARIVEREYRTVNGKKMIMLQMNGTLMGIKFTYLGYYFTDTFGSTQLVTFTSQNLFPEYRAEAEAFLNGLVFADKMPEEPVSPVTTVTPVDKPAE